MADFIADVQSFLNTPVSGLAPATRLKVNRVNGRVRLFHSLFKAPVSGTAPAIADRIIWGRLPVGARILGNLSRLDWNTGTASCTLNLGDNTLAARHLAATAITTAGSAVPAAAMFSSTALCDTTIGSTTLTNVRGIGAFGIGDLITGTGIATAATVVGIDKAAKTVIMSLAATATNANQTITAVGTPYETSDDTANVMNAYTSTYDDSTLISTVAGAQVANNQMISLAMAYVLD